MQFIKNTWRKSTTKGKVLISTGGLFVTLCLCSALANAITPRSAATPTATAVASISDKSVAIQVTVFSTEPAQATQTVASVAPATEAPTAQPEAPTEAPAATDAPVATASQPSLTVKEGNDAINVRSGPDTSYDQIGQLQKGQTAPITGKNADATWWQINLNEQPGWVFGELVTLSGDLTNIIVASAPAAPVVEEATAAEQSIAPPAQSTQDFDRDHNGSVTCDDFDTQAQAKVALAAGYSKLDGSDHDGNPCEDLPVK
jgi:uncharacterized protein YraI